MRMYDIILKKRDGGELSEKEINFFISEYTAGNIPDYQASALMMAIYFQGMTDDETVFLTEAMAKSGDMADLSRFGKLSVDKHSTGGVGDKTTLIVSPIVAALGGKVAKMSGRGLGHTGGTVDKLESIKGYKTSLERAEFLAQIEKIGIAVIGQSGSLAPADKKLYALRDVTATVNSIPLITSSIMSKKIAGGSHNIVLDVKVGSGAFMKTPERAHELAQKMVKIGKGCGKKMAALITDMDTPLGFCIGNSLEVAEAVRVLSNKERGDLYEVCVALASAMVSLVWDISVEEAEEKVCEVVRSGAAFDKMKEWIAFQGGDVSQIEDTSRLPAAEYKYEVICKQDGYITKMDAEKIGSASVLLGAGRAFKEEEIDYGAGIVLNRKTGDKVSKGDVLCTLYTNRREAFGEAEGRFMDAVTIGNDKPDKKPLIYKIIK